VPLNRMIEERRDQIFPTLAPADIDRIRRFGEVRSFAAGERLETTGQVGPGLLVVLAGKVKVTRHDHLDMDELIVTHGPGRLSRKSRPRRSSLRPSGCVR